MCWLKVGWLVDRSRGSTGKHIIKNSCKPREVEQGERFYDGIHHETSLFLGGQCS